MEDLKKLSDAYRQRSGIDTFKLQSTRTRAIQRESGSLTYTPIWSLTGLIRETGKSLKLNRQDMVEMQTITAEGPVKWIGEYRATKQHLTATAVQELCRGSQVKETGGREGKERKADERRIERVKVAKARKEAAVEAAKNAF